MEKEFTNPTDKQIVLFLQENMKTAPYERPISDEIGYVNTIRVPFFINYSETRLDMNAKDLRVNVKEGIEVYSKSDEYWEAMKFKFGNRFIIPREHQMEDKVLIELLDKSKEEFIKSTLENIKAILKSKTIVHNIHGYCGDENCDCNSEYEIGYGHKCGTITYHILGVFLHPISTYSMRLMRGKE